MCLFSKSVKPESDPTDNHTARGPQQARAETPGTRADLLPLCAHCKHSRGDEGGSSPWTRKLTQTLLRRARVKSPSCEHKALLTLAVISNSGLSAGPS